MKTIEEIRAEVLEAEARFRDWYGWDDKEQSFTDFQKANELRIPLLMAYDDFE